MQALEFARLEAGSVGLDFCFPCQVIWFDASESTQLTPGAVLDVFKALHENRAAARNPLPDLLDCPRCQSRLTLTHDIQHTTRFTYFRCGWGHGRLSPFMQFLLEKNFVRPLSAAELASLKDKVRTIQCSNCGAPIDLEHDLACPYCRSPVSILDQDFVAKTVRELSDAEAHRHNIDVGVLSEALLMQPPSEPSIGAGDLVAAGIAALAAILVAR